MWWSSQERWLSVESGCGDEEKESKERAIREREREDVFIYASWLLYEHRPGLSRFVACSVHRSFPFLPLCMSSLALPGCDWACLPHLAVHTPPSFLFCSLPMTALAGGRTVHCVMRQCHLVRGTVSLLWDTRLHNKRALVHLSARSAEKLVKTCWRRRGEQGGSLCMSCLVVLFLSVYPVCAAPVHVFQRRPRLALDWLGVCCCRHIHCVHLPFIVHRLLSSVPLFPACRLHCALPRSAGASIVRRPCSTSKQCDLHRGRSYPLILHFIAGHTVEQKANCAKCLKIEKWYIGKP